MPTTEQDARALTFLACRIRAETFGAREWDEAGTFAEIKKFIGHNLPLTVERVTRHASDPQAQKPSAMQRPFVPDAPKGQPAYPPKADDACRTCGFHLDRCVCVKPVRHLVDQDPEIAARGAAEARRLLHCRPVETEVEAT